MRTLRAKTRNPKAKPKANKNKSKKHRNDSGAFCCQNAQKQRANIGELTEK